MPIYYKKVRSNSCDVTDLDETRTRFSFDRLRISFNTEPRNNGLFTLKEDVSMSPLIGPYGQELATVPDGLVCEPLNTKFGTILVVRQRDEDAQKPVILTYHDIGLNYYSNFDSFFSIPENKLLMQSFRLIHVNAPGQEDYAENLARVYVFPTMEQISEQIVDVCKYYNIKSFIGFGFGAGANVLTRFALKYPDSVEGLFLINPSATTSTWLEWFYQKRNIRALENNESNFILPEIVKNYLLWHLFGNLSFPRVDRPRDQEAINLYQSHFNSHKINGHNLALFIESFINRTALNITRNSQSQVHNLKCPVVVLTGAYSPLLEESVKMNCRLDPSNSTWISLSDCSMVLEEKPQKVAEAFRLFLQGIGYTLKSFTRKRALMSGKSMPCLSEVRRLDPSTSSSFDLTI